MKLEPGCKTFAAIHVIRLSHFSRQIKVDQLAYDMSLSFKEAKVPSLSYLKIEHLYKSHL